MLLDSVVDWVCTCSPCGRFTISATSLAKTAVMMKKISRLRTKSSIGARSMPWDSSRSKCRRRRMGTSVAEPVGEQLRFALSAVLEVERRVQAGDAHGQARQRADHGVGHAAGHGA